MTAHPILYTDAAAAADGVVHLWQTDLPAIIGRARGHCLSAAALAIAVATAETEAERRALATEMIRHADLYVEAIAAARRTERVPVARTRLAAERAIVIAHAERLAALPRDGAGLTRRTAIELGREAREDVVPAIYRALAVLQEDEAAAIARRMEEMRERAALVEGMFAEMRRIGRTIGFISINASVEAARAGGETGRAFGVIAEEVRALARRSSEVLAGMRARLILEGAGAIGEAPRERPAPSPPPSGPVR